MSYKLPARVAAGWPLRIRGSSDTDGGWTVIECVDRAHALQVMADHPRAEMPCWRRIRSEV